VSVGTPATAVTFCIKERNDKSECFSGLNLAMCICKKIWKGGGATEHTACSFGTRNEKKKERVLGRSLVFNNFCSRTP
jgi:hypothetical protein